MEGVLEFLQVDTISGHTSMQAPDHCLLSCALDLQGLHLHQGLEKGAEQLDLR